MYDYWVVNSVLFIYIVFILVFPHRHRCLRPWTCRTLWSRYENKYGQILTYNTYWMIVTMNIMNKLLYFLCCVFCTAIVSTKNLFYALLILQQDWLKSAYTSSEFLCNRFSTNYQFLNFIYVLGERVITSHGKNIDTKFYTSRFTERQYEFSDYAGGSSSLKISLHHHLQPVFPIHRLLWNTHAALQYPKAVGCTNPQSGFNSKPAVPGWFTMSVVCKITGYYYSDCQIIGIEGLAWGSPWGSLVISITFFFKCVKLFCF